MLKSDLPDNPALSELRQVLKTKFSTAHRDYTPRETIASGIDWIDQVGLEKGCICEISGSGDGAVAGGAVILGQMIQYVVRERQRLVLIDGADAFDPSTLPAFETPIPSVTEPPGEFELDSSFLWARCRGVAEAVKVADMILRDGNLPRTVIDLQHNSIKEIRAIPASSWLRLRSLTEDSGVSCVMLTPGPVINCAALRFDLKSHFSLDDLEAPEFTWRHKSLGVVVNRKSKFTSPQPQTDGRDQTALNHPAEFCATTPAS